ncbi:conserved hypothetical protein [Rippkaea orientalis PCC 8801]|uniref:Uncharacterized protein n=1 Tax=Rippkaea orientalis (strain PCC 8801 / RF-1) TaxID=41431 RepID=B7K019_RIPO1|nr:hypothetical protein [Rippkaea orientalis]ACK66166.1 conserved hypothetical protein [Rippkaea orientalis PCC 8801]
MNNAKLPSDSLENNSLITAQILSQTPGRMRLRVAPSSHRIKQINRIVVDLRNNLPIDRIKENLEIGTITVFHNPQLVNGSNILEQLTNFGLIFSNIPTTSPKVTPDYSKAALGITEVTQTLNQRVRQTSDGLVDLGFLIPLGFAILAWRQLRLKGWQLDIIPWYVLAWYAFDSFLKLQPINRRS